MIQRRDAQTEKEIGKMVGAMCDPTIVYPGYEDCVPEKLKDLVPLYRLIQLMKHEETASDVEAAIYMSTASLAHPFNETWTQIYLYTASQVMGDKIPKEIRVQSLTKHQEIELRRFKDWLYRTRIRESTRRRHALEAKSQEENINAQPEPNPQMAFAGVFEGLNNPGKERR